MVVVGDRGCDRAWIVLDHRVGQTATTDIGGNRLLAAAARDWRACGSGRERGSSFPRAPIRSCLTGCSRRLLAHAWGRWRLPR